MADLELAVVIGSFEARTGRQGDLAAVLAQYVVLTRRRPHCRNVDLVASAAVRNPYIKADIERTRSLLYAA